ncbi:acetoacetate decarboxylase family protein [Streptomyces sp. NPDC050674]|uniref:acetoacetate decarboxylase family protein n=1 Tax=Streptomyces sp. NPDC050674 TaxID=3157216 RepID=UPI00341C3D9F
MERPAVPFPPSPWRLTGDMIVSLWRVPPGDLPSWPLPPGARPWIVRRRATLLTFWVDYRPGGVLAYREFLVALAVRHGHAPAATAVAAWVDSEQSRAGGRALWGIPKEPGTFTLHADSRSARAELTAAGTPPVRLSYREVLRLPFRVPARGRLVQRLSDGTVCRVPMRIGGRPGLGRGRVTAEAHGPLPFLTRHRPLLTVSLRDFRGTVGS